MAELADAHDSKSCGKPCGFESHLRHQMCDTCVSQRIMNSEAKHGSAKLQSHVSLEQKAVALCDVLNLFISALIYKNLLITQGKNLIIPRRNNTINSHID